MVIRLGGEGFDGASTMSGHIIIWRASAHQQEITWCKTVHAFQSLSKRGPGAVLQSAEDCSFIDSL